MLPFLRDAADGQAPGLEVIATNVVAALRDAHLVTNDNLVVRQLSSDRYAREKHPGCSAAAGMLELVRSMWADPYVPGTTLPSSSYCGMVLGFASCKIIQPQ